MPGATAFGSHYFKTRTACERLGYYKFRAPHPAGGVGLEPLFREPPLLIGGAIHTALEIYYRGYARGDYAPEPALHALTLAFEAESNKWSDPDKFDKEKGLALALLERYMKAYGPGGPLDERRDLTVLCDAEGPLIERELRFELATGVWFTCRPDAIVEWKGWIYVLEHKTPHISYAGSMLRDMDVDLQATGECYVVAQLFPDRPVHGVLVNVLAKGRAQGGRSRAEYPEFLRDPKSRTPMALRQFELEIQERWARQTQLDDRYDSLVQEGVDPHEAASRVYLRTGFVTGYCAAYNRTCQYMPLCSNPGFESSLVDSYRPATRDVPDILGTEEEIA